MKTLKDILTFMFGASPKQRYRRMCLFLIIIFIGIMLIQNLGYNKKDGFSWRPAAEININKEIN